MLPEGTNVSSGLRCTIYLYIVNVAHAEAVTRYFKAKLVNYVMVENQLVAKSLITGSHVTHKQTQ